MKSRFLLWSVACLSFGGAARAQTTNCVPNYAGGQFCQTTPLATPPPLPQSESGGGGVGLYSILSGIPHQRRVRDVGRLMAAGKCVEARDRALRDGDFDLASKVLEMCQYPTPSNNTPPTPASASGPVTDPSDPVIIWSNGNIHANGWRLVGLVSGNVLLYDQLSKDDPPNGHLYREIRMEFFNTMHGAVAGQVKEARSGILRLELDCPQRLARIVHETAYAANNLQGGVTDHDDGPEAWSPWLPGQPYRVELDDVCK